MAVESHRSENKRARRRPARWGLGLAAVALALSPALMVLVSPPERPSATAAPAISSGPAASTPPKPARKAADDPAPPDAAAAREHLREAGPEAGLTTRPMESQAGRQEDRQEDRPEAPAPDQATSCAGDASSPGGVAPCLYEAIRTSEQALEVELARALQMVTDRSDLAPVQRARWKALLEEAQSRFLLYRNFDCQSVAPFEGRRGIGNFEARALCLVAANRQRAEDLTARYALPAPTSRPRAADDGPQHQLSAWTHAGRPPLN